jgi:hypothetical protein
MRPALPIRGPDQPGGDRRSTRRYAKSAGGLTQLTNFPHRAHRCPVADNNFDNAELTEMRMFLADWLAADQDARVALDRFIGRAHASRSVRDDLYRFGILLGGTYDTPGPDDRRLA